MLGAKHKWLLDSPLTSIVRLRIYNRFRRELCTHQQKNFVITEMIPRYYCSSSNAGI